jgi:hypothetical protein
MLLRQVSQWTNSPGVDLYIGPSHFDLAKLRPGLAEIQPALLTQKNIVVFRRYIQQPQIFF